MGPRFGTTVLIFGTARPKFRDSRPKFWDSRPKLRDSPPRTKFRDGTCKDSGQPSQVSGQPFLEPPYGHVASFQGETRLWLQFPEENAGRLERNLLASFQGDPLHGLPGGGHGEGHSEMR